MHIERQILEKLRLVAPGNLLSSIIDQLRPLYFRMLSVSRPEDSDLQEMYKLTISVIPESYFGITAPTTTLFKEMVEVERRINAVSSLSTDFVNEMRENSYSSTEGPQRDTYARDCWHIVEELSVCQKMLYSETSNYDLKSNQWHEGVLETAKDRYAYFNQLAWNLKIGHIINAFEDYYPDTWTADRVANEEYAERKRLAESGWETTNSTGQTPPAAASDKKKRTVPEATDRHNRVLEGFDKYIGRGFNKSAAIEALAHDFRREYCTDNKLNRKKVLQRIIRENKKE